MRALALALALLAALPGTAAAGSIEGIPLPRRSRAADPGGHHVISGLGFRKTVVYYRKHFARRGIKVKEIPVYGYRDIVVSRFLAQGPSPWLAVHIFRLDGKTHIYVVPAPQRAQKPLTEPDPAGR